MNYLLDTNIVSEPARKQPNSNVMQRLAQYDGQYVTAAIVWHELQYGCELLAESKRKTELQSYLLTLQDGGLIIAALGDVMLVGAIIAFISAILSFKLDNSMREIIKTIVSK